MNYSFLLFRCKQLARYVRQTGALYILLPFLLLSGMILQGLENLITLSDFYIACFYCILTMVVLSQRTDYNFLIHSEQSVSYIYLVDIGLYTIPLTILLFGLGKWKAALWILGVGILLAFLWPAIAKYLDNNKRGSTALRIDIPLPDLEFKYIIRRYGIFLGLFYILCLLFSANVISIFIFTFIFIAIFQSSLEYFEPKEMIFYHASVRQFLWSKIFRIWMCVQLLIAPFYAIGLISSFEYWYLFLLIFAANTTMIVFSICNKYVFYRPATLKYNSNILAGIMLIFMLVPGFQLVVLVMSIIQYYKAKRNLNYYW